MKIFANITFFLFIFLMPFHYGNANDIEQITSDKILNKKNSLIENTQKFYPDFEVIENDESLQLIFIKVDDPSDYRNAKIYSIDKNNKKTYVSKIVADEVVSIFQADAIVEGQSVYVLMRSRRQDTAMDGFYFNTMELPIIKGKDGISVMFFPGDLPEPELMNCFDGMIGGKQVSCKYKTETEIRKYIKTKHAH